MSKNSEVKTFKSPVGQNMRKAESYSEDGCKNSEVVDKCINFNGVSSYYSISTVNNSCRAHELSVCTAENNKESGKFLKVFNSVKNVVCDQFSSYLDSLSKISLGRWTDSGDNKTKRLDQSSELLNSTEVCGCKRQNKTSLDSSRTEVRSTPTFCMKHHSKCGITNDYNRVNSLWHIAAAELYDGKKVRNKIYSTKTNSKQTSYDKDVNLSQTRRKQFIDKSENCSEISKRKSQCTNKNIYNDKNVSPKDNKSSDSSIRMWRKAADELCKNIHISKRSTNTRKEYDMKTNEDDECNIVTRDRDHVPQRTACGRINGNHSINQIPTRILFDKYSNYKSLVDNKDVSSRRNKEKKMVPVISNSFIDLNHDTSCNSEKYTRYKDPFEVQLKEQLKRLRKTRENKLVLKIHDRSKRNSNESSREKRNTFHTDKRRLNEKCESDQQVFQIFNKYKRNKRVMNGREAHRMRLRNMFLVNNSINNYYNFNSNKSECITFNLKSKSESDINKVDNRYCSVLSNYKQLMLKNGFVDDQVCGGLRREMNTKVKNDVASDIVNYTSHKMYYNIDTTVTCQPALFKGFKWNSGKKKKNALNSKQSEERPRGVRETRSGNERDDGFGHMYPSGHKDVPVFLKGHQSPNTNVDKKPSEPVAPVVDEPTNSSNNSERLMKVVDSEPSFNEPVTIESIPSKSSSIKSPPPQKKKKEKKHKKPKSTEAKELEPPKPIPDTEMKSKPDVNASNKLEPCAICNKMPGSCICFLDDTPKKKPTKIMCNKFCKTCKSYKGEPTNNNGNRCRISFENKVIDLNNNPTSTNESDLDEEPMGFLCCCQPNCSFKNTMKKMFCVSLPSTNSSETGFCFKRKKEYSPACTFIFKRNESEMK